MPNELKPYHIASCSCGNDSMAMVLELIRRGYPLHEVVRYNNPMGFNESAEFQP